MKSLFKMSFQMERFASRAMGINLALLMAAGLVVAILTLKPDVHTFEERVVPYVDCPDDEIEEFIEVAQGKKIVRCKQNIPPGINEVLKAEREKVRAEAVARHQAAQSSGTGSSRPAGCDRAELASRVISDYFYYGNDRPFSELDAALNAIAYFLEQNNFRYEARAIDTASSLEDAISVYSGLIPQICSR